MKFKIFTVNFLAIMLTCILVMLCFSSFIEKQFFSAVIVDEAQELIDIMPDVTLTPDTEDEEEEEQIALEKKKFTSFQEAYVHAFTYLHNSKGYTSVSIGTASASASIINIIQTLAIYKEVNYISNTTYSKLNSKKQNELFGQNTAIEYFSSNSDVFYRRGTYNGTAFVYPTEYVSTTFDEYLKTYSMSPIDLLVSPNETMTPTDTKMTNNGVDYVLNFRLTIDEVSANATGFILQMLATEKVEFDVQPGFVDLELKMDLYGVLKSIKVTCAFDCYFPDIPTLHIPIMCSGGFTSTETFSKIDKNIAVHDFRLA